MSAHLLEADPVRLYLLELGLFVDERLIGWSRSGSCQKVRRIDRPLLRRPGQQRLQTVDAASDGVLLGAGEQTFRKRYCC